MVDGSLTGVLLALTTAVSTTASIRALSRLPSISLEITLRLAGDFSLALFSRVLGFSLAQLL